MPKVSQEHLDARRQQILDGARRAFARHGYAGATVALLEQEIGLSRGAIFNYFPSKLDLFVAMAVGLSRRYADILVDEGLDAAMRAMAEEDPDWLAVLLETELRLRQDAAFERKARAAARAETRVDEWFAARRADGTFRADVDAGALATFATIVLNGLGLRVLGRDSVDLRALLRLLHDALAPRE